MNDPVAEYMRAVIILSGYSEAVLRECGDEYCDLLRRWVRLTPAQRTEVTIQNDQLQQQMQHANQ